MRMAIVTSSYRGDLDRCRLLCESIDRHVEGHTRHYILVEHADMAVFRSLETARRRIVDERSLLPSWLRPFPDPTTFGRRRIWLSPKGPPLRGWHVQQLRRLAFAATMDEDALLSCDSDIVFFRDFDLANLWTGDALRFYAKPSGIDPGMRKHLAWHRQAARFLGIDPQRPADTDYIATAIAWRRDSVREALERIERVVGRPWIACLAATRELSECQIYGRFVDEVENRPDRHVRTDRPLCNTYWTGEAMNGDALRRFLSQSAPDHVALGVQSFTGTDPMLIRQVAGLA